MDDEAAAITISAKNQMKFLCSHGGKILPRPADGQLKYVGGETRLVSVPTDISFQQLMQKLCLLSKGEMILKYQVVSEDLDALVSVKSEEDVVHMFDEINNWENARRGSMLRAFLFHANPNHIDQTLLEQGYVDAINGMSRCPSSSIRHYPTTVQHSSAGSSPSSSPDSCTTETTISSNQIINMHKVRSMPNICGSYKPQQQNSHHIHQVQHQHYQSHKLGPLHLHISEKLSSVRSGGRADGGRYQLDQPTPLHYYPNRKQQTRGNGHCTKCLYSDDNNNSTHFSDTRLMINGTRSRAMSPVPSSTRLAHALG